MADVSMNGINTPAPMTQPAPVSTPVRTDTADKSGQRTQAGREKIPAEKELENVVSVSKDGDTVQASPNGVEKLTEESSVKVTGGEKEAQKTFPPEDDFRTEEDEERAREREGTNNGGRIDRAEDTADRLRDADQRVENADDRAKEARDRASENNETNALERLQESQEKRQELIKAAQEAQEKRADAISQTPPEQKPSEPVRVDVGADSPDRRVNTYAGISDQQLSQMYRDGEISKYSYDSEIASRKERAEEAKENNAALNEEMTAEAGIANRTLQNFNAIENAYTKEQTIEEAREATRRLEAMDTVQKIMTQ